MAQLRPTPSQTVGPYFSMRLATAGENALVREGEANAIRIVGAVFDADGKPFEDALLEIWQADARGIYAHAADARHAGGAGGPAFLGFGRAAVDPTTLTYRFDTIKPGRVPGPDGSLQAPHVSVVLQGRGMLRPLFTRLYFDDETAANDEDFLLARVAPERRHLLLAGRVVGETPSTYRFDLRLQGPNESVFFDF